MPIFNSLRFRLLLTMSVVVLVAIAVIAVSSSRSATNEFQRYLENDTQGNRQMVSEFLSAYESVPITGSLQNLVKRLSNSSKQRFIVVESTGLVLADSDSQLIGQTIQWPRAPREFLSGEASASSPVTGSQSSLVPSLPFSDTREVGASAGVSSTLSAAAVGPFGPGTGFAPVAVIPASSIASTATHTAESSTTEKPRPSLILARLARPGGSPFQSGFVNSVNRELLLTAVIAGVMALLLSWLLSRRILRPVEALTAAAGRMEKGDLTQRVAVNTDDEIGKLAHAFNSMSDGLATLEQARRNMVTDVAHELRTPIANITGYLEAMRDGVVKPDREIIVSLYEEARLLGRLVEDLQELELAEAGKLKLVIQRIDAGDVIKQAVTATQPAAAEKKISLQIASLGPLPAIEADPERIGQVLRNLLNNAVTHTPEGGCVSVEARYIEGAIDVAVRNTGPGIPPEHLPYIFDRFYRADHSRNRSTGGAGLGLAIVKKLVEMHGGDVRVESTPGVSTAFYFTLPCNG